MRSAARIPGRRHNELYQRHVLLRLLHLAMRQEALLPFRRRVIGAAEGQVLEIGIVSASAVALSARSPNAFARRRYHPRENFAGVLS